LPFLTSDGLIGPDQVPWSPAPDGKWMVKAPVCHAV
jgi:hypothetical protein